MKYDSDFALPRVEVTGRTTHDGQVWYKVSLENSETHSCIISGAHLDKGAQPVIDVARNLGFALASWRDRDKLLEKVGAAINGQRDRSLPSFAVATHIGWTADLRSFVTPQQYYGRPVHVVGAADLGVPDHADYSRGEGRISNWQNSFRAILANNPLFVFGACVALMPPLLALVDLPGCMMAFTGPSSLGKTTLLDFIGSLRGGKPHSALGFQESFRATKNSLESYGLSANDTVLVIDDIRSVPGDAKERAKLIEEAIYLFATGREKNRRDGSGKPRSFRTVAVTSDNFSLQALLDNGGVARDPSMDARLIQIAIPPEKGVIEGANLTREQRSDQIANIRKATRRHYGFALHKFLKRLVEAQAQDREEFRVRLCAQVNRQVGHLLPDEEANTVGRSAHYFGLAYAAGRFAIKHEILPITEEQLRDAIACAYELHLAATDNTKADDPVALLRASLREKLDELIVLPISDGWSLDDLQAAVGLRRTSRDGGHLLFTKTQLDRLLPPGITRKRMCDALLRRDLLDGDKGISKKSNKNTRKVRLGSLRERFYCISERIICGGDRQSS